MRTVSDKYTIIAECLMHYPALKGDYKCNLNLTLFGCCVMINLSNQHYQMGHVLDQSFTESNHETSALNNRLPLCTSAHIFLKCKNQTALVPVVSISIKHKGSIIIR